MEKGDSEYNEMIRLDLTLRGALVATRNVRYVPVSHRHKPGRRTWPMRAAPLAAKAHNALVMLELTSLASNGNASGELCEMMAV